MSISGASLCVARLDTGAVTINSSYPSITLDDFCLNLIMPFQACLEDQPPFSKIRHPSAVNSHLTPDHPIYAGLVFYADSL